MERTAGPLRFAPVGMTILIFVRDGSSQEDLSSRADDLACGEAMKPMNKGDGPNPRDFSRSHAGTTRLIGITYKSVHWESL